MGEWENGRMGEWENGRMGEGENGRRGEWENGRMGEWENGRISDVTDIMLNGVFVSLQIDLNRKQVDSKRDTG